jgi:AAA+ ATPase superfamily predicted ATPase
MNSPFPYETYAENESFYGREVEKEKILSFANTSTNLVIYSKRRLGKSSLVREVFRENKEYLFIYCDMFDITSKEDFASNLLHSLASSIKGDIKVVLKRLSKLFKRVSLVYSADPQTGKLSLKPDLKALSFQEMMDEFFNTVFELSKKQKIVIALDEFQQISTLKDAKIDAILRKYIQENYNISYIFLGSKRHMLNRLFEYGAPLFEEAVSMQLETIKQEDINNYVSKHLNISDEIVEYIYDLTDGETKFIQHIFHILFVYHKRKEITISLVDEAILEIIHAKSSGYKILFDTFSQFQKKAFKALSKYSQNIHSKDVLDEYNISKGSMQSALKQLYQREIIDKEDDVWFIPDRTLELWGKTLLN